MAILTDGKHSADFLVSEANNWRSRDEVTVTVPANTTLEPGTILGKITASGKFVRHDAAATDGSETEAAVLLVEQANDTGSAVDVDATAVVRDAELKATELVYASGANAAQITASNAALAAVGLIVR